MARSAESVRAVIKAYDVRGLVDEQIDEDFVREVGGAFARLMRSEGAGRVVVGHDMRDSSPRLSAAFAEGVTAQGLDVVTIGLASTDQLYFASVFRHTRYLAGEHAAVEDLVQEVFARALVSLREFDGRSSFSTWLHGIAVNVVRNHWRRNTNTKTAHERLRAIHEVRDAAGSAEVLRPLLPPRLLGARPAPLPAGSGGRAAPPVGDVPPVREGDAR